MKSSTKLQVGQKVTYKNSETGKIYWITKVYWDGAIECEDEEGDEFSFETSEFEDLKLVK